MHFCEKLDLLMKISNTTNSALALHVNLDASHISRLRRGKRSPLTDTVSLSLLSEYLARRCADDYQRKALADVLGIDVPVLGGGNVAELVMKWLIDDKKVEPRVVGTFLKEISNIPVNPKIPEVATTLPYEISSAEMEIFYGIEGKRQAVIDFLSEIQVQKKPQTLLLYSDEPTDWMTADRKFSARWAALMVQVIAKGNRIKIIHTVSRDLDEMLNAISQWMPLHLSGLIESYYYPKKRDGVFKRTLFIAPNTSAVISSSTGNMINKAAIFMLRSKAAVEALTEEFNQYLNLCSPLMQIFTPNDRSIYIDALLEFEKEKSDSIIITESLSLLTMPEYVVSSIIPRIANSAENIPELWTNRMSNFKKQLQSNSFTEVIRLFEIDQIKNEEVKIASSDMLSGSAALYTLDEYILHLENIRDLLNNYENFHVHLTDEPIENQYMVYVKEDLGAIIAKTSVAPIALAFNESNLTAGFWDYLRTLIGEKAYRNPNKKDSSDKLTEYINQIKSCL